ncbi:site-specific integrase [Geotalea sp. SG265]|uniref:tyrosine-type recombinase/integrase n=1 Tax=Geotalea sp. SG265 TaxID=2922867 RepID=UPI001FAFB493|nr:site-specific integrase [Geotalea sp. SG265]
MGKDKFTNKYIMNLKPTGKIQDIREGDGFGVRVLPSGIKTFFYLYTFDGKRRFLNLGHYDTGTNGGISLAEARRRYTIAKKQYGEGKDPLGERERAVTERRHTPFVADFIDEYINQHAKEHNRGWKEIERALKAEIAPRWGKRKITDIRRRDLVLVLDEIKRRAPVMANRVLAYTRKLFSYAVDRAIFEANPFMGMDRPSKEKPRERALTADEIKTLWPNLDKAKMSDSVRRALKLLLITGQRPGEVISMHSSQINGRWWTIPPDVSKNGQAHRVYLTDMALDVIGCKTGYIFESPATPRKGKTRNTEPSPYKTRTMNKAIKDNLPHKPESKVVDRLQIAYFTPHDLRRTASTFMAEIGVTGDIIDRVQNHTTKQKQGMGHIYNRYDYAKEKQSALEALAHKLTSVISGKEAKVISLHTRKK